MGGRPRRLRRAPSSIRVRQMITANLEQARPRRWSATPRSPSSSASSTSATPRSSGCAARTVDEGQPAASRRSCGWGGLAGHPQRAAACCSDSACATRSTTSPPTTSRPPSPRSATRDRGSSNNDRRRSRSAAASFRLRTAWEHADAAEGRWFWWPSPGTPSTSTRSPRVLGDQRGVLVAAHARLRRLPAPAVGRGALQGLGVGREDVAPRALRGQGAGRPAAGPSSPGVEAPVRPIGRRSRLRPVRCSHHDIRRVIHGSKTYVISGVITVVTKTTRGTSGQSATYGEATVDRQAEREEDHEDRRPSASSAAAASGAALERLDGRPARRTSPRCPYAARRRFSSTPPWAASSHHSRCGRRLPRGEGVGVGEAVEHVPVGRVRRPAAPSREPEEAVELLGQRRPCLHPRQHLARAGRVDVARDGHGDGGGHASSVGRRGTGAKPGTTRSRPRPPSGRRPVEVLSSESVTSVDSWEGRMTRAPRPDFLVIGAPKAGTTALHAALAQHPDVFVSDPKEPKYWLCDGAPPPAWCGPATSTRSRSGSGAPTATSRCSSRPREHQVRGESTPFYLWSRGAHRRIAEALPEVRLVAVVRDPIDRAYSNWMHLWSDGLEPESDFVTAFAREDERVRAGWAPFWRYRELGLLRRAAAAPPPLRRPRAGPRRPLPRPRRRAAPDGRPGEPVPRHPRGARRHDPARQLPQLRAARAGDPACSPRSSARAHGSASSRRPRSGAGSTRRSSRCSATAGPPTARASTPRSGSRLLERSSTTSTCSSELTGQDFADWLSRPSRGSYAERAGATVTPDQRTQVTRSCAPSGRAAST